MSGKEQADLRKVIFVTDSRGRGLREFIKEDKFLLSPSEVIVTPGATINTLQEIIRQYDDGTALIIVAAGICNLTQKFYKKGKPKVTYHRIAGVHEGDDSFNLSVLKDQIRALKAAYRERIIIATIPPGGLVNYSTYIDPEVSTQEQLALSGQQLTLEEDIIKVNEFIFELNTSDNLPTIRLDKSLAVTSVKKSSIKWKYKYNKLLDGFHPKDPLKKTWFKLLANAAAKHLGQKE